MAEAALLEVRGGHAPSEGPIPNGRPIGGPLGRLALAARVVRPHTPAHAKVLSGVAADALAAP